MNEANENTYLARYLALRDEIWIAFEALVRRGARFPALADVTYPRGINPPGLSRDTDGNSWFYASALMANPEYQLHHGEDLIVGANPVVFIDQAEPQHRIEPNTIDVYWLAQLLDAADAS